MINSKFRAHATPVALLASGGVQACEGGQQRLHQRHEVELVVLSMNLKSLDGSVGRKGDAVEVRKGNVGAPVQARAREAEFGGCCPR